MRSQVPAPTQHMHITLAALTDTQTCQPGRLSSRKPAVEGLTWVGNRQVKIEIARGEVHVRGLWPASLHLLRKPEGLCQQAAMDLDMQQVYGQLMRKRLKHATKLNRSAVVK